MAQIIAVANQKGGVGKTTTTVNLAAALAGEGKRVLILDMDPQGNAGSGLGVASNEVDRGMYELLLGTLGVNEAITSTVVPGVEIIPSGQRLIGAEVELVPVERREHILAGQLLPIRDRYDYIFADCPPSLGLLTINTLTAAGSVLIPIQCEYYALEGLTQLLNAIQLVQQALNPSLAIEGILLTMFDARLNLCRQVADEARAFFGERVYRSIIPRNVRLSEAPSFGMPVMQYDRNCIGSRSYITLAREMLSRHAEVPSVTAARERPGDSVSPPDASAAVPDAATDGDREGRVGASAEVAPASVIQTETAIDDERIG